MCRRKLKEKKKKKKDTHYLVTEEKQPVKLGDDNETIAGQGTDIITTNKKAAPNNYFTSCNAQPESDALTTL